MGRAGQFWLFWQNFKGPYLGKYFTKYAIIWQIFFSDQIDEMCKFSSKSGGVPFQISFFLGDLTRNDPVMFIRRYVTFVLVIIMLHSHCIVLC